MEDEKGTGASKKDREFEKSLDTKLEKSCSRGSLDEKRQLERHSQTPKEKQKARRERTEQ